MANIVDKAMTGVGEFSWAGMGTILVVIMVVVGGILFFVLLFGFMWWKSFNYKVKIYEPIGQIELSEKDMERIKSSKGLDKIRLLERNNIKFDSIKFKRTHGRFITIKGTPFFQTFMPLRKHAPVPMELMFSDGIHLLRLSREIFVSIPQPKTLVQVGENTTISVSESNKWIQWNNMMSERINLKYQDVDNLKRTTMYFIVGIASMVILGAFILWLIYNSVNKGYDAAEKFNQVADSLIGGAKPA